MSVRLSDLVQLMTLSVSAVSASISLDGDHAIVHRLTCLVDEVDGVAGGE